MTSKFLSRLIPPSASDSPSIYETLRQDDDTPQPGKPGTSQANLAGGVDGGREYRDYDQGQEGASDGDSQLEAESTASLLRRDLEQGTTANLASSRKPQWMSTAAGLQEALAEPEYLDDDVPESLLVEGGRLNQLRPTPSGVEPDLEMASVANDPLPGPPTRTNLAQWQTTRGEQPLHVDDSSSPTAPRSVFALPLRITNRKQLAEQRWETVVNLDNFLKDVYEYYLGNGIWSILLTKVLNLLTVVFVIAFSTFLSTCVEYGKVPGSKRLPEVLVPHCTKKMSGSLSFALWIVSFLVAYRAFNLVLEAVSLRQMHDFYHFLLNIPDSELQTISWQEVVARLMALRDKNPTTADVPLSHQKFLLGTQSKQRMDAHDIANRIMRKENYLIALFNKDVLDFTLPIPFLRNRQLFSNVLQWNLSFCILDYVFNEEGQVRPLFTKASHRRALSDGLRQRFIFAGCMNLVCAPFIISYCIAHYFLRYFTEYQRNPSRIGSRQYTPLAEWKFREFNELWHLFQRRINMSYPFASRYVDQFPKDKMTQLSRFVAFIAGALAAVLAVASVFDPEVFLGFEITPDRTVLFYLGVFGTVWAVARGAVPEESLVFDPEFALREVIEYTHYFPSHWKDRLHSDEVKREFSTLYQLKIVIFLEEMLSLVFTPFVLWFSLPKCSDRVVDFFREFTIDVDGLGKICSFAEFDFQKAGNNIAQPKQNRDDDGNNLREDYYATKDGKMLASYFGFLDNYATNPKPGVPYMYHPTKRSTQPPSTFSGLPSPESGAGQVKNRQNRQSSTQRATGRSQAIARSTVSVARGSKQNFASPMPSILLDPHHQPSASGFKSIGRTAALSRAVVPGPSKRNLPERKEVSNVSDTTNANVASTGAPTNEDSLGGSWKTTRAAAYDDDSAEEAPGDAGAENGGGVLGLLYQLQKAQTGPRTGTLNM